MSYTIAVAGKGGVGKTSITGLLIDYMQKNGKQPILVVDADANSNLNEVLGIEAGLTIGQIREEIAKAEMAAVNPIPANMNKQEYADLKFSQALVEDDYYDMIIMGRTQGEGCYCFVNGVLRSLIQKYSGNYKYTVVDNEAGLEHLSRGVLPKVDAILLVSDCSRRGIQAVARISDMIKELDLNPSLVKLIVNRAPNGELNEGTSEEVENKGLDLLGVLPQDQTVYEYDCDGKPLVELPDDNPFRVKANELFAKLGL